MASTSPSFSKGLKELEEEITCPICLEHFTNPKVLPCFHSFCLHCLQRTPVVIVDGNYSLPCPTCRYRCPIPTEKGLASLPLSFVIINYMEMYEVMKKASDHQNTFCDNCGNTNADRYCKQCAKFFCQQCLHFHDNWKPNASHQTISLDEVNVANTSVNRLPDKPDQLMVCSKHEEPLRMFCEDCQTLICQECSLKKHKDHNYEFITKTYHLHKEDIIQSSLQPLGDEFNRLTEVKQMLTNRKNEILCQAETTKGEIHHTVAQIKNHLDEMERKLVEDVNSAVEHKVSVLNQQIKEIDTILSHVAECRDHIDQCIKVGTPQQVLSTKPQMMSRSRSIINNVKEKTFHPLEQPDIELVKCDDIIDQMHNMYIGKIICTLFKPEHVAVSYHHIPLVGKESSVNISISFSNCSPTSVPPSHIKCHLIPSDYIHPIKCTVKESSQSGIYNVVFTPLVKGLHQLHITINNFIVPVCPVSVPVSVPPEKRGTPIKTTTGFSTPRGVAVTDDGLVIVSENEKHCITIVDNEGKKIRSIGAYGKGKGQLKYPTGVAVTSKGTILVSEFVNNRIQEFTIDGESISCVGRGGNGPLMFNDPCGIAIDKATGHVFVVDKNNHRVQVLRPDLTFSHMLGSEGSRQGRFKYPHDVTVDSQGFVYVTDSDNHRVQKLTLKGQFVSSFGIMRLDPHQLHHPSGITVDDNDLLYVNNDGNQYVTVYSSDGRYISSINKKSLIDSFHVMFNCITFDNSGNLLVCCTLECVIKTF